MPLLSDDTPPAGPHVVRRMALAAGAAALLVIAGLLGHGWLRPSASTPSEAQPSVQPSSPARSQSVAIGSLEVGMDLPGGRVILDGKALGEGPRIVKELAAGVHHLRVELAGYETWEQDAHIVPGVTTKLQARMVRPAARLHVDSDVPGASVFLDQKFSGRTPLDLPELATGPHRLSVSAEGYDMYDQTLDVTPGTKTVNVRFKEVRLDEALDVVHHHALGSCSGRLSASTAGLRYETSNAKDAFAAPLTAIERLEVDYVGKTLTVKMRGGRTYDFGVRGGSADPLLVFQQHVERARERLAVAVP
jgi:hypothetical protein